MEVKYVRDSAEYATLCRLTYRIARTAVTTTVKDTNPADGKWGVILDIDETTLDNSQYQLERGVYGLGFEEASWADWVQRHAAGTVPGVKDFVKAVRAIHGKVIFISDRYNEYVALDGSKLDLATATRDNLEANDLFVTGDLLCLKTNANDTKASRRKSVVTGSGVCSTGAPLQIVAFVGDQMGDFPQKGEPFTDAGIDQAFGKSFFLLPQPMYGKWTNAVTRTGGAFQ
jgi:5'-nucleotidase (lipoprotein e(P4) family)